MSTRVAINGLGRIGRTILKLVIDEPAFELVAVNDLVEADIVGDPRASVVDLELTKVVDGDLLKIMSWYDNEWGYANQMLRQALAMTGERGT